MPCQIQSMPHWITTIPFERTPIFAACNIIWNVHMSGGKVFDAACWHQPVEETFSDRTSCNEAGIAYILNTCGDSNSGPYQDHPYTITPRDTELASVAEQKFTCKSTIG